MGLQQLWSGGLGLHGEPAHAPPSVQLPPEQSGCEHRLRSDLVSGCCGERRGEPQNARRLSPATADTDFPLLVVL